MRITCKKVLFLILIGIIYLSVGAKPVEAAPLVPSKFFGITEIRTLSEPNMGYAIGNPNDNNEKGRAAKIWNIVEYSSKDSNDPKDVDVYCVKAGVGFTDTHKRAEYNVAFDMYKERDEIAKKNDKLSTIVENGQYNNLLALANLLYLPETEGENELTAYLKRAGIVYNEPYNYLLTVDDVKAVQQAAIWYFTNYGEEDGKYDKTYPATGWLNYILNDETTYKSLSDYKRHDTDEGLQRQEQAERLYNYLINTAKANGSIYADENKDYKTKLTLYTSTSSTIEQPLMEIEREKEFDLSLRKYITKVNEEELTEENSRVPQIDVTGLNNLTDTTATYKHKKDPLLVGIGDTVTYRIQVYNEGDIDGYVNKIVDQLPTGLQFSKLLTSGYTASYDSTSNKVTITRDENNNDRLTAFNGSSLDSTTLELECIVTSTESNKILTNVAWISEEETIDGKVITNEVGDDRDSEPTNAPDVNKDNMENYKGNSSNKDDLTDKDYYYKGEQDDDDFEKLITKQLTGSYNLQLEKVDKNNPETKLQGAVFSVTLPEQNATNKTTGKNGLVDLGTVNITNVNSTDTITIKEITPPTGYNKLIDTMTLNVTKKIENGSYVADKVTIAPEGVEGTSATIDGNTIKIVVPNEKIEGNYKVQLEKVDKDDNTIKLPGAEFNITLPGASSVTSTTDENGLIDLGNLKITDVSTTDTITIEETKAPDGYNKILGTMQLSVTKKIENGSYVADNVTITSEQVEGTTATLDGNVIKIVVENEKKEGNYKLQLEKVDSKDSSKKLEGAEFSVTLPGKAAQTMTTNPSGLIDLGTVKITDVNTTDTITIEETKAPEGYNKILGTMTIEVEKQDKDGVYSLKNATITSGQVNGTNLIIDGNTIKITVADELITGNYGLQLEKVDSKDNTEKLSGAEFSVTLPGKEAETKTTDENGLIDLGTVEITNIGTKDTITIEETKAPNGYNKILDIMTIEVEKQLVNGEYKPKSATIISGEVAGTSVTLDGDIVKIVVADDKITGNYNLQLEKVDIEDNTIKLPGAEFSVTLPGENAKTVITEANGIADLGTVEITGINENDTITIEETKAPENYDPILGKMTLEVSKIVEDGKYIAESVNITSGGVEGTTATLEGNTIKIVVSNRKIKQFDLALRKYISKVNDKEYDRAPQVDITNLANGTSTTAIYNHPKTAVSVKPTDIVTYTIRVYNEGEADGYANEVTDFLPPELEFLPDNEVNQKYEWQLGEDGRTVTTDYLSKAKETEDRQNLIKAFDGQNLNYKEVQIVCKIKDGAEKNKKLTNLAEITEDLNNDHEDVPDKDSTPDNIELPSDEDLPEYKEDEIDKDYVPGQEDDDDFEKIIIQEFDLSLRKFIVAVSNDENIEENELLKNEDGTYSREPVVDTSLLNTTDENGNKITTAIYNHTKEPVEVRPSDYVVYMLRVYNEGEVEGYASEIKDHLPPYLEFVDNEFNKEYGWSVSEDGRTVTTNYLGSDNEDNLIKGVTQSEDGSYELSYKEVPIMCKVNDKVPTHENITNIADITEYQDEDKNPTEDRDSEEDNVELPSDEELPNYKDDETGEYVPGQEDDDDFEKVVIKEFDLALRKFITKVENQDITNRIPEVSYDAENDKITYNHTKDPVQLVSGNVVIYTIRVYNEGEINGYAKEITDDIPEGLEFIPDNETNINYRWVMYDEAGNETDDVSQAVTIKTDYLSKEQEENPGDNLLHAFNPNEPISETNPEYKDVQVAFRVTEPNSSDRIVVNSAQISDDSDEDGDEVEDKDSVPGEWNDGEDDQDKEYVKLLEFDLSLRKWVTQAIVIDKDGEHVTETGHQPYDDPEQIVKVDLYRKSINDVTVKFRYSIRVTNEGEIAGYAKEITDYVPEGLKFVAEDNPGWTDEGNNVISTRLLENTLLQPGEYADVEVVLTWINDENNMGLKENTAEISEDYNDYGVPDKDSTPDNKKEGEDDIDDAPVMLSVGTGRAKVYFTLGFVILVTMAGGVFLIKKYVL